MTEDTARFLLRQAVEDCAQFVLWPASDKGDVTNVVDHLLGDAWAHLKDAEEGRGDGVERAVEALRAAVGVLERFKGRLLALDDAVAEMQFAGALERRTN